MKERPECAVSSCKNPAYVYNFGRYYCGECIAKAHNAQKKVFEKVMEDI